MTVFKIDPVHNNIRRQRVKRERARSCQTPQPHTLHPPTYFKSKLGKEAYPRTAACGGTNNGERGHGGFRHRGSIHSTKRGGERARLCQTTQHHTTRSRGPFQTWSHVGIIRTSTQLFVQAASREEACTAVPDAVALLHPGECTHYSTPGGGGLFSFYIITNKRKNERK